MHQHTDQSSHVVTENLAELNIPVPWGLCVEGTGAKESNVDDADQWDHYPLDMWMLYVGF